MSLLAGLVFGLAPALHVARPNLQSTLKEGGRGAAGERGSQSIRRMLVVAETALALTLLTGAGLLIKSFARLQGVDPGFVPERMLTFNLALPDARYAEDPQQIAFFDRVLPALRAAPGVRSVGATSVMPFGGGWSTSSFEVEGYQVPENQPLPWGDVRIVTPGFLETLRVPVIRGRLLTEQDRDGAPMVAVIDEEFVRRYWPRENPIGKRFTFSPRRAADLRGGSVVGVVSHTKHEGLDASGCGSIACRQIPQQFMTVAVRTGGDRRATSNGSAMRSLGRSTCPSRTCAPWTS
jgi:putative ABC transport system permease protein